MTFIGIPLAKEAPLAKDFSYGTLKLQPVVFSHGIASDRMMHSTLLREMASHGFLVVALNHNDGTCSYTQGGPASDKIEDPVPKIMGNSEGPIMVEPKNEPAKTKGKGKNKSKKYKTKDTKESKGEVERAHIKFYANKDMEDVAHSRLLMEIREAEMHHLISEVIAPDFLRKTLGFTCRETAKLDTARLVVIGH